MSGICGICEAGREWRAGALEPMLEALRLPGDSDRPSIAGRSAILGATKCWEFQQTGYLNRVSLTVDADIVDFAPAAAALSCEPAAAANMPIAELVLQLYFKKGLDFVKLLHGAFAVALWDENQQRLVLAIDRLGIKSLYWHQEDSRLLFASRIGAVRANRETAPEANPKAILQFLLFASVPAPLASDLGTAKLRPGTFVTFKDRCVAETQYWDATFDESKNTNEEQWAQELRENMRVAVHRHLEGRAPQDTGCFLSGGTDSSSVVAFASEKHKPTQSFSIAFEEAAFSEIDFARTTAATFQTRHFEKFLNPQDACDAIDKILDYYQEPFANSSAIGSYYCATLAKDHGVNILLAGDGGDEVFAGNERYATDKRFALYHEIPTWLRRGLIEPLVGLLPKNENSKLSLPRRYVRRANIPNPKRILSYGFFLSLPPEEIFEEGFLNQVGRDNWLEIPEEHFVRANSPSELNRILYLDLKMTLADNDLRKVSGTAELAGVNVRYPLLDDRLIEFAGRIPPSLKLKGFEKRYIFKQAMKGILPDKTLYKKKHGFGVPLAQWLLENPHMKCLMQDVLHDSKTVQRGYFRPDFYERLMRLHKQQPNFYGEIVWYFVALEIWHRKHLERTREPLHAG
jgi:asparagine synthase (glutamine-hydrolysing)